MNGTTAPAFTLGPAFSGFDPVKIVSIIAWLIFVMWVIYTLVATYHWFRYGRESGLAIPALLVHVIVSLALALFAVSGFK